MSIPLAILHAIAPDLDALGIMVTQYPLPGVAVTATDAVEALHGALYHHATSADGVILLSPPPSANGSVANMLAFGNSQSAVARSGRAAIQCLSELTKVL